MNKAFRVSVSLLLVISVCFSFLTVGAEETEVMDELHLSSADDLLTFAEQCRLDSFSVNLHVVLDRDLDVSRLDFSGIPSFSGTFEGNAHEISGICLTEDGSVQGFFRYLTEEAVIQNLKISGQVSPGGSKSKIGGLAGSNAGCLENCSFTGAVTGGNSVGGLVGINQVSGVISSCKASGTVIGDHFAGGLAGENLGLIESSANFAKVNDTAADNSVALSDITLHSLTKTEAASTVTDIGGIAGASSGVILTCENRGEIGYPHMGYNIGGIAGSMKGYTSQCSNYGRVSGRKEVGGIAGQMEPISRIEYTADTLQALQTQLEGTSQLTSQASANAQGHASAMLDHITDLENQGAIALDALHQVANPFDFKIPSPGSILAAKNTVASCVSGMQQSMDAIHAEAEQAVGALSRDVEAISRQISAIGHTISHTDEQIGGKIRDVSDEDTGEDHTGKIELCRNHAQVLGDLNVGGIVGAIAWENDLDPEDDFQFSGDRSMNFDSELRAVVLESHNLGAVSAKKKNAGGIAGRAALGLIKRCTNTGELSCEDASQVGGIAGTSAGYIRECSSKCQIQADSIAGGIAGTAAVATDCRSLVQLVQVREQKGGILGNLTQTFRRPSAPVRNNYYLAVQEDPGAIDSVSYHGQAEALSREDFLALPDLSDIFIHTTVTFIHENGTKKLITLPLGGKLSPVQIPKVPQKDGKIGSWSGLSVQTLEPVYLDQNYTAAYEQQHSVITSTDVRADGKPIVMLEGAFADESSFTLSPCLHNEDAGVLEAWGLPEPLPASCERIRYAYPAEFPADTLKIYVMSSSGEQEAVPFQLKGSYLVFPIREDAASFALVHVPKQTPWYVYVGGGAFLMSITLAALYGIRRKCKIRRK